MASAAIRRCAARSLRLRQPLEQQLRPLERRFSSSSVPAERSKCSSSDTRSRGSMEQKSHINEKKEDIYQRLSTKIDKISDGLDEHTHGYLSSSRFRYKKIISMLEQST
ncbi:unnamed protein product [Urochloa humidicola]